MTMRTLISGGVVLTMDPDIGDLAPGDVLIQDDRIVAVAPHLDVGDAQHIDATNRIVMPGLIDTHRHLWQSAVRQVAADWTLEQYVRGMLGGLGPSFSADDVQVATLLGCLEALNGGITTIFDWAHIIHTPQHADAAVAGLRDSGMRAVFGYGAPRTPFPDWYAADVARIRSGYFSNGSGRVTMALASLGPEFSSFDEAAFDLELARKLDLWTSVHLGVGLLGRRRSITVLDELELLGPDVIYVHCNTCNDAELGRIAQTGGHVSISPRSEMQMGHGDPAIGRLVRAGVHPSLSVDVVSAVGGSLFAEMRGVLEAARGEQNRRALAAGRWPAALELTTRDAVRLATIEGARTLGMEASIGSLTPGKQADIITLRVDLPNLFLINDLPAAVTLADSQNVDAVFVAGRMLKVAGRILSHDLRSVQGAAARSRDRLLPHRNCGPYG